MRSSRQVVVLLMVFLTLSGNASGTVIWSTGTGGNWNAAATWEGGIIPAAVDDVVIRSGAVVSTVLGASNACHDLLIQPGAVLLNNGSVGATLTINGSFTNSGSVRNGTSNLTLNIYGDVEFTGTEWAIYKVSLFGTTGHTLTFGAGQIFTGGNFTCEGIPRQLMAPGGLSFAGTVVDLNNSTIVLAADKKLALQGQFMTDLTVTGTNPAISLTANAYLGNATLQNATLQDTIRVGSNNIIFEGITVIDTGAMVINYGTSHTVNFNGSVINHGTIANGANLLTVNITGDLTQCGLWTNYATYLTGFTDQSLTFGVGACFSGGFFNNSNSQVKTIIATTDLDFRGTSINFAWGAPGGARGTLRLPDQGCLKISGLGSACSVSRITLSANGDEARLWLLNGAWLQSFSNSCNVLKLMGCIQAGNNEIFFNNELHLLDTLMNYSSTGRVVYFSGSLTNVGYIMNGPGNLELRISGDLTHHGVEWSNYKVWLDGLALQTITPAPFAVFSCGFLETNASHPLSATGSLHFHGTRINLQNSLLTMNDHDSLCIHGPDARLLNVVLDGKVIIKGTAGAYFQSVSLNDDITVAGIFEIYNNAVIMNADLHNLATIRNQNITGHTLYIEGDVRNDGTIENGTGMGNLTLEIKGDIVNSGLWSNYENRLNGTGDQHVRLVDDQPVNARFVLYANQAGTGYQWYKNGALIPGATGATYLLNQVTSLQYGRYYCVTSAGQSRIFTIAKQPEISFTANPLTGCAPLAVQFTDNTVSGLPVQGWLWDFGDGSTSSAQHPWHTYQGEGNYHVTLTVYDGYVSTEHRQMNYISAVRRPVPDFSFTNLCLNTPIWFTDLTTGAITIDSGLVQYASEIIDYSSQWSATNWSAQKILGPPDVYPQYGDDPDAWASETENGQREYIELRFPVAMTAGKVIIYETLYPGAVDSVYVRDPSSGLWILVWSATAQPEPLTARAFEVPFPVTAFPVNEVRIAVNSPAVPYWNEIDAVALVSPAGTFPGLQTNYLWDVGENGMTLNTKGNISYVYQNPGDHVVSLTVTNDGVCSATKTRTVTVYALSAGGNVTGGSVIRLGQSTGPLVLEGYTGTVDKWQKRLNEDPWSDIDNQTAGYSELPVSVGLWQYRAQVHNMTCVPVFSDPGDVVVLKPILVTWNGSVSTVWTDPMNWTPAYVPDEDIDVLIPADGIIHFPVITGAGWADELTIDPGAVLTILPGCTLTAGGDVILSP